MVSYSNRRGVMLYTACGLLLLAVFVQQNSEAPQVQSTVPTLPVVAVAHAAPAPMLTKIDTVALIQKSPLEYLRNLRANYDRSVRDYTCQLTKQELLVSGLTDDQVTNVKFREGPYSVYMDVIKNPGQAKRIIYVKDKIIKNGQEQAVIEPAGSIARLLVKSVLRPIEGKDAQKASRRSINEFGFARTLDLVIKYAEMAGEQSLRFLGESEIDNRPTYSFERRLPYGADKNRWPDALLRFHIDQEWQVPVACYSYEDHDSQKLLGKYIYTNVNFNVGLQPSDFEPSTYGL